MALGSADALFSCPDAVTLHGQSVLHSTSTCSLTEPEGVLFCCPVWAGMEARAMNGHTEDKPKDCRYCYFWKQTEGCTFRGKTGCYYVSAQKPPAAVSECDGCPYGRASPCIGWCTKELLRSMGLWKGREDTGHWTITTGIRRNSSLSTASPKCCSRTAGSRTFRQRPKSSTACSLTA